MLEVVLVTAVSIQGFSYFIFCHKDVTGLTKLSSEELWRVITSFCPIKYISGCQTHCYFVCVLTPFRFFSTNDQSWSMSGFSIRLDVGHHSKSCDIIFGNRCFGQSVTTVWNNLSTNIRPYKTPICWKQFISARNFHLFAMYFNWAQ